MTLGAGPPDLPLLPFPPEVAAAMATGALASTRSACRVEVGGEAAGSIVSSGPSAHPDAVPTASAMTVALSVFAERTAIRDNTKPSADKPPSAGAARSTLAAQADLWQGLQICTSAGSPGAL